MRLAKAYGNERLEVASGRALAVGARSYKHVAAILKNGLDRLPAANAPNQQAAHRVHSNLRGPDYYQGEKEC
jgi:hypothetical protein